MDWLRQRYLTERLPVSIIAEMAGIPEHTLRARITRAALHRAPLHDAATQEKKRVTRRHNIKNATTKSRVERDVPPEQRRTTWKGGQRRTRFLEYETKANRRGIDFHLTIGDFDRFWRLPCHYCGAAIRTIGLDRQDNRQGYILANVVPCCSICNTLKGTLTMDVFLAHAEAIRRHLNKPTYWIDKTAIVGAGTKVWHYASILAGAVIGKNCSIGSGTEIGSGTIIDDDSRISAHVFLPSLSRVGKNVFIGPGTVATDDRIPRAGNFNYIAEPPIFKDYCSVGAGCSILPGVSIGVRAMIGAGSVVTRSVPDGATVYGEKAKVRDAGFRDLAREYGWMGG